MNRPIVLTAAAVLAAAAAVVVLTGGDSDGTPGDHSRASAARAISPSPSPSPTRTSSETLPLAATGADAYALPPSTASSTPFVGKTMPASGTAAGKLVTGFPAPLAPPTDARIVSSSLTNASGVVQAALVVEGNRGRILFRLRSELSSRGFVERWAPAVENAPALVFARGDDTVTLSTRGRTTYLLAHLRKG